MGVLPELANITSETIETYEDSLEGKKTFKFDFEKKEFVTDIAGNVIMTKDAGEVLEQVVNKILHDRRYKNLIYPDYYGNEIDLILNQDEVYEVVECELQRIFEEALVYHPLIDSLTDFYVSSKGDKIICQFTVNGVDGTTINRREVLDYGKTAGI